MNPALLPPVDSPDFLIDNLPVARPSLRLAVVTETYPPEVNGVAMTVARLVQGLQQRGHDLQLVRPRQPVADAGGGFDADNPADAATRFHEVLMRGLPIPRYPQLKMGLPARRALVAQWARRRPDLVHIATEGPLGWSALQAATHLRLPVTSDFRTNFHAYSKHYGVGWLHKPIMAYLRKFHNRTHCTMVPTEALRRELADQGFAGVAVVGRGVDALQFSPARHSPELRASWGAGPDTLVVACVGRLAPEKNLGLLVDAFEAMRAVRPDSLLLLVGDGPARREWQARCPAAVFAGTRSGLDLAAHYASADAFVFPSTTETFGNVTPEAMASGLPVVAYDYAAAARLIRSGENGLLAPLGDAAAFTRQAEALALDLPRARAMGALARQTALLQQWEGIVGQVEGLMKRALHQTPDLRGAALRYAEPGVR